MTIRHMKIFIAVYQTGSITRAAEKLHMTQPVVTRIIQELERYYGVRLFERINQRISVTEAGKQFYAYALHIIDSFDQMEQGLRSWDELGVIRVGASVTLGSMLLPKVLKEYQAAHSGITVKVTVTNGTRLQSMLENNELDFCPDRRRRRGRKPCGRRICRGSLDPSSAGGQRASGTQGTISCRSGELPAAA